MTLEENKKWFKNAKFGMMVHFGLYSLLGGEYKGKRTSIIGEWAMHTFKITVTEYEQLAVAFNPIYFNADEGVKTAKNAGTEYIVVTSKHHEGFCLFKSEVDNYNCVDGSPFKRDIIAEFAEACYKHNIKLGLYYSQCLDWHEFHGGEYTTQYDHENNSGILRFLGNSWDFMENDKKDYNICFENKIKPQVTEILKNYGDISLIWFDTPTEEQTHKHSAELYNLVRKYQPSCLVNSRIGIGLGDYSACGDNITPDEYTEALIEAPVTLSRRTWGYKSIDNDWKNAESVYEMLKICNSKGAYMLLNVGPDLLGRIPAPALDTLQKVGEKLK